MTSTIQQSDKTLMNMYSVHKFYLQVLQEIQDTLLSDKKERYMLNWDQQQSKIFIQAVKHYLNHQPTFFNQALQKYSNNQIQTIIPKRRKRKNSTLTGADSKSVVSHKSKNTKKEGSVMGSESAKKQTVTKSKKSQSSKKQPSVVSNIGQKNGQHPEFKQPVKQKFELKKQEDDMSDDLMHFPAADDDGDGFRNLAHGREEDRISTTTYQEEKPQREEAIFYEDDSSQEEQSLGEFVEKACTKSNALVFGNFATRQLRRKAKEDKIELQLSNCFVKMFKNGRDAFFERMTLNLFKQQKTEVKF